MLGCMGDLISVKMIKTIRAREHAESQIARMHNLMRTSLKIGLDYCSRENLIDGSAQVLLEQRGDALNQRIRFSDDSLMGECPGEWGGRDITMY